MPKRACIIITDEDELLVGPNGLMLVPVVASEQLLADLHVILSWCPADNAAAARVRALLPKEEA